MTEQHLSGVLSCMCPSLHYGSNVCIFVVVYKREINFQRIKHAIWCKMIQELKWITVKIVYPLLLIVGTIGKYWEVMNMILGAHYVFLLDRTKHVPSHPTPFTLPQCIFIKTYRSRHIKLYELVCFDTLYCTLPNQNKIPPSSTPFEFDCCTSIFILKSIFRYSKMKYDFF